MSESDALSPGTGPTTNISVSLHTGTVEALRAITGKGGLSAFVEDVLTREIERRKLSEIVKAFEEEHGPITAGELAAAEAELFGEDPHQAVA